MGQSIPELAAKAERSEREYQKLRKQEVEAMISHGRGYGHITMSHRYIAWYDRKRLAFAIWLRNRRLR